MSFATRWFERIRRGVRRRIGEIVYVVVADPPDAPHPGILYIIGEEDTPWCGVLACPCGCGDAIRLSLVARDRPSWRLVIDNGRPTLSPSIHRVVGCRSHFFLRAGKIVWADRRARR